MLNKNDCKTATWRDYQRHGTDIKQIHIKLEEQELQENKQAEWEMQQNSKFYNAQDEEQEL